MSGVTRLTFGTLFSGAGGACAGLRSAGLRQAWAVDNWDLALRVHGRNLPGGLRILNDVSELVGTELPPVDVLWGSPPCVDFSTAASGHNDPERGLDLVREYLRIVREMSPRYWVMENVPAAEKYLRASDYPNTATVNAADVGVPQNRIRWFGGRFRRVALSHAYRPRGTAPLVEGGRDPWVSMRQALRLGDADVEMRRYIVGPRALSRDMTPGTETFPVSVDGVAPVLTAAGARSQYRLVVLTRNGPKDTLTPVDAPAPTVMASIVRKMLYRLDAPAHTVTATEGRYAGSPRDRRRAGRSVGRNLTVAECSVLQGFPESWDWSGVARVHAYTMIGNAVPPPVSRAFGEAIVRGIGETA